MIKTCPSTYTMNGSQNTEPCRGLCDLQVNNRDRFNQWDGVMKEKKLALETKEPLVRYLIMQEWINKAERSTLKKIMEIV